MIFYIFLQYLIIAQSIINIFLHLLLKFKFLLKTDYFGYNFLYLNFYISQQHVLLYGLVYFFTSKNIHNFVIH